MFAFLNLLLLLINVTIFTFRFIIWHEGDITTSYSSTKISIAANDALLLSQYCNFLFNYLSQLLQKSLNINVEKIEHYYKGCHWVRASPLKFEDNNRKSNSWTVLTIIRFCFVQHSLKSKIKKENLILHHQIVNQGKGISRTPAKSKMELFVTLSNGLQPITNNHFLELDCAMDKNKNTSLRTFKRFYNGKFIGRFPVL